MRWIAFLPAIDRGMGSSVADREDQTGESAEAAYASVPRSWSEKLFYAGTTAFAGLALHTELNEPNAPWFWSFWAALLLVMGYGFVAALRKPLIRAGSDRLTVWRSPYTGAIDVPFDGIGAVYVLTGRRKLTIEIIRKAADPLNVTPNFLTARHQQRIITLLRECLGGRVDVDPLRTRY